LCVCVTVKKVKRFKLGKFNMVYFPNYYPITADWQWRIWGAAGEVALSTAWINKGVSEH